MMERSTTCGRRKGFLWMLLGAALWIAPAYAQNMARVQFIHNAADPALQVVDVYLNEERLLNDFAFRKATPFIEVPEGNELSLAIAPGSSRSAGDALVSFPMSFLADQDYVVVANGVLYPAKFAPNPSGKPIELRLFVQERARLDASQPRRVQLFTVHGATDAPAMDVTRAGDARLVEDLVYGDVTGYVSIRPLIYVLGLQSNRSKEALAKFLASTRRLRGDTVALITSGFADPAQNQDGPPFALLLVQTDGTVTELPPFFLQF